MKKDGLVYSTNPNIDLQNINNQDNEHNTSVLSVCFEKKGRAGKGVTIIKGFTGSNIELALLSRQLKKFLSIGGSIKHGEIILQGRFQEKVMQILEEKGYKTKKVGG